MPRPLASIEPPGTLKPWAGSTTPEGYLLADGSLVSTTTYAALFAAIGYQYGGSGGSFGLPDCREKVTINQNPSGLGGLSVRTRGSSVGANTHALTSAEMPRHYHTLGASGGQSADHSHGFYFYSSAATHSHGTGTGDHSHQMHYTSSDSYSSWWSRWDLQGYQNCCVYTQCTSPAAGCGVAGQTTPSYAVYHQHSIYSSGGVTANHQHTGTTGATGGTAHSNVGPSIVMRMVVKY